LTEQAARLAPSASGARSGTRADGWWLLGFTVLAQAGFSAMEQGVPVLAGFIRADLGVSATVAGIAVSCFLVGKILGSYPAGVAADALGERAVFVGGGLITAAVVIVAAPLPAAFLFLLLMVAGVANAAATPAGGRLVMLVFPRRRFALAQGIRQTGVPLGGLLAAVLLPVIAATWGWRWSLVAAAGLTALLVVPLALPATGRRRSALVDDRPSPEPAPGDRRAVRLVTVWGSLLVTGQFSLITFLGPDLHERIGLSLASASLVLAVALGAGVVGRVAWGFVADLTASLGRKWLLSLLTALGILSALVLLAIPPAAPLEAFVAAAALAGLTLFGYQAVWYTMLAEAAGEARVGTATGFAGMFLLIAAALTPPAFGAIADLAGTYRAVWAALAIVLSLGVVPALLVRERIQA
jgi:MFS family permease